MDIRNRLFGSLALLISVFPHSIPAEESEAYATAIMISNRAGTPFDSKIPVLEDLLTARIADLGFQIISPEVVIDAARKFDPQTASSATHSNSLEARLSEQSSAQRIAQGMGADYLIYASIAGFSERENQVRAYNTKLDQYQYTLRVAYKIIDSNSGGTLTAGVAKATHAEQNSIYTNGGAGETAAQPNVLEANVSAIVDDLLDDATLQISKLLSAQVAEQRIVTPAPEADWVTLQIEVETADLYVPDVRLGPGNTISIQNGKLAVVPLNVTVEVDGVAVGSAPGTLKLKPGFSQLRLSRSGYVTWERTIHAREGQTISAAMVMTEAGLDRWKSVTGYFNELVDTAKITDATVEKIKAQAQMLEQSGFKVDLKVDTTEGLTIDNEYRSIFGFDE